MPILSSTVASYDQAHAIRPRLTQTRAEDSSSSRCLKAQCQANAAKATQAVKAAGVAKRILELKGAADLHDACFVSLPWYGKEGKRHRNTYAVRDSGRGGMRARLTAAPDQPEPDPDLTF